MLFYRLRYVVVVLLLLSLSPLNAVFAQANMDDLKKQLAQETNSTRKLDLLLQIADGYRNANPDSCRFFARMVDDKVDKETDPLRQARADLFVASYYNNMGKPDSALYIAENNFSWLKDDPALMSQLAQYYSFSGLCLMKLDRKKDALDRFYMALQKAEQCNDNLTQLKGLVNIGWAMMELNQFESAIGFFQKALNHSREKKISEGYSPVLYNNMASCYGSLNKVDSAYKYSNTAIEKARLYGDISAEANGLFIMGTALQKQGKLTEALQTFLQAVPLRKKVGDPFFIVSDLSELSLLYSRLGKTTEGVQAAEEALQLALQNDISAKLPMIYSALAANYEAANDFEKASGMYKKINALKDSMYADANPKALAEVQTLYETEKQARRIEQQNSKLRFQSFLFIGIGVLIVFAGLLIHSHYRKYRFKKEAQLQVTLRKQEELATRAILEAEENERQRIAKDLHDGVGQMMSAAKMNLSAFESSITFSNKELQNSFEKVIDLVDESCKEVRTVSHIMMPHVLFKNGLGEAIRHFTDKLDKKSLTVHVFTEGLDQRLDSNTETILYRVIQECVNNVIKHAAATTLDISVIKDADGIDVTIEDNGKGFDMSDKEKFEGIGLKNIRTRIEYLKGTVDFDSSPGRGTAVTISVPV